MSVGCALFVGRSESNDGTTANQSGLFGFCCGDLNSLPPNTPLLDSDQVQQISAEVTGLLSELLDEVTSEVEDLLGALVGDGLLVLVGDGDDEEDGVVAHEAGILRAGGRLADDVGGGVGGLLVVVFARALVRHAHPAALDELGDAVILVEQGAVVAKGDKLAVLEAMKMQHEILAEIDGRVETIAAVAGKQIAADDLIMEIIAPEETETERPD